MTTEDRLAWRKSTYSGNGEGCVDVAPAASNVYLRHSKRHDDGIITFKPEEWQQFIHESNLGTPSATDAATVLHENADTIVFSDDTQLRFNEIEWAAFVAGIRNGEFDFDSELN